MSRPTEKAQFCFMLAAKSANRAQDPVKEFPQLTFAVKQTAEGLSFLADGLRATYILLEEVKQMLQRQSGPSVRRA